jgi:hypothetical protein
MPGRPMVGPRGFCWRRDRRRTAVLASRSTAAVTLLFMVVSLPSLSGPLAAGSPADRNQPVRPARRERGESDGADNLGPAPGEAGPSKSLPPVSYSIEVQALNQQLNSRISVFYDRLVTRDPAG